MEVEQAPASLEAILPPRSGALWTDRSPKAHALGYFLSPWRAEDPRDSRSGCIHSFFLGSFLFLCRPHRVFDGVMLCVIERPLPLVAAPFGR